MMENIEQIEGKMRVQRDVFGARKVPLEIERTKTNFRFILSMSIYLALWLGIAIFAGCSTKFDTSFNLGSGITPASISEARWIVAKFSAFTALMSLSYIILSRHIARALVYATISIFCLLLLAAVCIFSYFCASSRHYEPYLAGLIISIGMLVPTVITVIVLRRRIQIAADVIREVSKVVTSFPSSLFFPILPCVLYGIVMLFSQATWNFLLSDYSHRGNGYIFLFHLINIFGFLWFMLFITGWSQTVLSGSFCTWYWSLNKIFVSRYTTITNFVGITIRYHLGTIACGSLMIVLRKFIQLLLHTIGRIYILFGCYEPIFGKLEKFMMRINHNAYVLTSSHGTGFFKSAKGAFSILIERFSPTLNINRIVEAILILGQLLIVIISALTTYGYCQWNYDGFNDPTPEALLMVIISGIVITISIFMVPKIATDSIFLCILEENEENDEEKRFHVNGDVKFLFLQNSRKI